MFEDLVLGVNNLCIDVFKTSKGIKLQRGIEIFPLEGIYDENYAAVDPNTGASIISTKPVLIVREIDIPGGKSEDDDRIVIDEKKYCIEDDQPDSGGMRKFYLSRVNT